MDVQEDVKDIVDGEESPFLKTFMHRKSSSVCYQRVLQFFGLIMSGHEDDLKKSCKDFEEDAQCDR